MRAARVSRRGARTRTSGSSVDLLLTRSGPASPDRGPRHVLQPGPTPSQPQPPLATPGPCCPPTAASSHRSVGWGWRPSWDGSACSPHRGSRRPCSPLLHRRRSHRALLYPPLLLHRRPLPFALSLVPPAPLPPPAPFARTPRPPLASRRRRWPGSTRAASTFAGGGWCTATCRRPTTSRSACWRTRPTPRNPPVRRAPSPRGNGEGRAREGRGGLRTQAARTAAAAHAPLTPPPPPPPRPAPRPQPPPRTTATPRDPNLGAAAAQRRASSCARSRRTSTCSRRGTFGRSRAGGRW